MIGNIKETIYKIINEPIKDIKCCSRLLHKNIVYHISTRDNEYAVKFFYAGVDKDTRFEKELLIYNYFKEKQVLNTSEIIDIRDTDYGKVLIMNWINGKSIKLKLKEVGLDFCYNDIYNMLTDLENIWSINDIDFKNKLSIDKLGISNRFNIPENQVLTTIIKNKSNIDFTEIIEIYSFLKNKINPKFNYVINSDISTHEYLIKDAKCYWVDFETFKLGNPNNDLARAFQSLTNSIYKNNDDFNNIFSIFKSNKYFNNDIFLYYLIEKLFSTIYTANDKIDDDEVNFYIEFIKQNFYKSNSLNIKKRSYLK